MSLYPSLEDMKVDHMIRAQVKDTVPQDGEGYYRPPPSYQPPLLGPSAPPASTPPQISYPSLNDYMGLDISTKTMEINMPQYSKALCVQQLPEHSRQVNNMIAPISGQTVGYHRSQVTNGIREIILCKDNDGRVGLRVSSVNSGIFVCLVSKDSPAALGGVRFGDQILQINGTSVAGFSMDQVHKLFKKADVNNISVIIRDRPFERTVTLHKDSFGHVGFQFKKGEIISLVKDSSASRNGLLTQHQLLEIDGQNVVGLKDKEISALIEQVRSSLTITIIPTFVYDHIVSKMSTNLLKNFMNHDV